MRTKGKILLMIAGGAAALVIAAFAALLSFDINSYKARIESAVSDAIGINITIRGKMGLSLSPLGISARDVHASGRGGEFLSVDTLTLRAELLTLLNRDLNFTGGELVKPVVTIVRDADGKYNYESTKISPKQGPGAPFALEALNLSRGTVVYLDKRTGEKIEFRDINLSVKYLSIADTSGNLLKNLSFTGNIGCKEMLQKNFRVADIKAPVKAVNGTFDLQPLSAASFVYHGAKKVVVTELKGITLAAKDFSISDAPGRFLQIISFSGDIDCRELYIKEHKFETVKGSVKAKNGIYLVNPMTLNMYGGKGGGQLEADISGADASYKINLKVSGMDFERFIESFGSKKTIAGKSDLVTSVTIKEKGDRPLLTRIDGSFAIEGNNLTIHSMDLDKVLTKYETSQEFNLVDLGAFFVAGPLSTAALKGYRYGDLFVQTRGGQGSITKLVSGWRIRDGKAEALDCALSTHHHRVALKGKLNLVSEHYENVAVAILDDKGCAKFKQPISGPFGDPKIGTTVGTIESLAGPVISLYSKAKRLIQGGRCEVFYKGSVPQPR